MQFQQIAVSIAAQGGEGGHEELAPLWAEPWVFGIVMFATVSYTNLGNRHEPVDEHSDPHRQHPAKHSGFGH